jgi:hypothetical protein
LSACSLPSPQYESEAPNKLQRAAAAPSPSIQDTCPHTGAFPTNAETRLLHMANNMNNLTTLIKR